MSSAEQEVAASRRAEEALEVGARLLDSPTATLVETAFAAELEDQRALAPGLDLADLAHAVMTIETGIVPAEAGGALLAALLELQAQPELLRAAPALGDLYTNREAWLAGRTEAAGWLGAGRARREATTVAYQLTVRAGSFGWPDALVELGRRWPGGRWSCATRSSPTTPTCARPSRPAWATTSSPRLRAAARPGAATRASTSGSTAARPAAAAPTARASPRTAPAGGAARVRGGGRSTPGTPCGRPTWPWRRPAVVVAAMVNADRLAEDLLFLSAEEVGLVELADGHARASKILPQKRNPYALAHVRAVAHRALGAQAAVASAGRTPSGQLDSRLVAYAEVPRALAASAGALRLLAEVVGGLVHDPARGAALLAAGQTWSTDLAEVLVLEGGLDYRSAHRAVGTLVRELPPGSGGAAVTAERLGAVASRLEGRPVHVTPASVAEALDPRQAVLERSGPGGAASEEVQAMAWRCESALLEHESWRARAEQRAGEAARALGSGPGRWPARPEGRPAMASSMLDSVTYGALWRSAPLAELFDEVPRTRAWLEILAVLAEVEGEHGLIPAEAAAGVAATCRALAVDGPLLEELARAREATGHSTAGLIQAVARRCPPGAGEWVYYGATVQDLTDTWLMATLRQARAHVAGRVGEARASLAALARRHRDTVMPGRTHGQQGLPITFGFKVAGWVAELRRHGARLAEAAARMDIGQLGGGVGSLAAFGPRALDLQARFCARLGLRPPAISWTPPATCWRSGRTPHPRHRHGRPDRPRGLQPAARPRSASWGRRRARGRSAASPCPTSATRRWPSTSAPWRGWSGTNAAVLLEGLVHDHERDGRAWKAEWLVVPELSLPGGACGGAAGRAGLRPHGQPRADAAQPGRLRRHPRLGGADAGGGPRDRPRDRPPAGLRRRGAGPRRRADAGRGGAGVPGAPAPRGAGRGGRAARPGAPHRPVRRAGGPGAGRGGLRR